MFTICQFVDPSEIRLQSNEKGLFVPEDRESRCPGSVREPGPRLRELPKSVVSGKVVIVELSALLILVAATLVMTWSSLAALL
jgi:hypothetical protein